MEAHIPPKHPNFYQTMKSMVFWPTVPCSLKRAESIACFCRFLCGSLDPGDEGKNAPLKRAHWSTTQKTVLFSVPIIGTSNATLPNYTVTLTQCAFKKTESCKVKHVVENDWYNWLSGHFWYAILKLFMVVHLTKKNNIPWTLSKSWY
jgi:hypothetical protein